ncbi:hypothetical protein LIZ98_09075 [Caldibacillus sp. 210928-DFI.2.18]|uniref:hypothetical protein n=1 Tax=unclassified Caldibacillus TaxID=2641266 RepID=UPI001D06B235|nr:MULTISPECIES: hypothetical protein [unclassified Caldibacillus]MCB7073566.1 hypothetical protein [Caldibacillus sp. 210928-DFI.2.18]
MTTRKSLVAKKTRFSPKKGDEKESRRQKMEFSTPKRRREQVSSPKMSIFRLKKVTRKSPVVKKSRFSPKYGDESGSFKINYSIGHFSRNL